MSLHVLSNAGCGKSYGLKKAAEPPKEGHTFNYRDSLALVLEHILLILVVGPKFLTHKFIPKKWGRIGQATIDFRAYMTDMVNDEKRQMALQIPGSGNLVTSLIRASEKVANNPEAASKGIDLPQASRSGLTEQEIYGNIFVYNFAGHDTMAITLNWSIYLLAAHPEIQDWIAEEIMFVLPDAISSTWNYSEAYPLLKRVFAVMVSIHVLKQDVPLLSNFS